MEQTVRRKNEEAQKRDKLFYRLAQTLMILFALYAVIMVILFFSFFASAGTFSPLFGFGALIGIVCAIILFIKKDDLIVEYDYAVEDDKLFVAKVRNQSSRKEMLEIPLSSCKRLEPYSKAKTERGDVKCYRAALNGDDEKMILYFEKNGEALLVFEPNEELARLIKKAL